MKQSSYPDAYYSLSYQRQLTDSRQSIILYDTHYTDRMHNLCS